MGVDDGLPAVVPNLTSVMVPCRSKEIDSNPAHSTSGTPAVRRSSLAGTHRVEKVAKTVAVNVAVGATETKALACAPSASN